MTLLFGFYFPLIPLICLIIAINRHSISGTITEEHAQFPSRLDDSMAENLKRARRTLNGQGHMANKKSIFRDKMPIGGKGEEEEEGKEVKEAQNYPQIMENPEKKQQEMEVQFLLKDEAKPEKRELEEKEEDAGGGGIGGGGGREEKSSQNEFNEIRFDPQFAVHNLCGPWTSGRQPNDLEWAEPADKLLKLLNSGRIKYNLFMAPGQLTGHATNVSVAIYIESMSSFKAQTMDFEVDMYFAMGWYDRRLAHNCTHPLLIAHKPISERIWTPDLYFLNAKFAYLQEVTTPNFMLVVYPDGLIFKTLRIDVTLSCNMDLQLFPFDKQECPMVIQSFAYIENLLNLSWHVDPPYYPIATNPELKLNDMAITGMRFERCSSPYTMFRGTGLWSCLRGYIVMKRLVLFHLIQTYIPSGMLVSISWMTFWLDPRASPARISLTITSLLTLTTMTNGARQDLPQVSYIKAMDIWQTFSQALIFLVLLEYSFVSYYFTRRTFHCLRHHHGQRSQQFGRGWNGGQREEDKKQLKQRKKKKQLMTMRVMMTAEEEEEGHVGIGQNGTSSILLNQNNQIRPSSSMDGANSLRRRRHSAEMNRINHSSAILATPAIVPPPPPSRTITLNALDGFRYRRLCAGPPTNMDEFELRSRGGGGGEWKREEKRREEIEEEEEEDGNGMGWTMEEDMMAKEEEGGDEADATERACQKCQQIDQKKARAIDKYSRVLFPTIFVGFCALYWFYYMRIMAEQ